MTNYTDDKKFIKKIKKMKRRFVWLERRNAKKCKKAMDNAAEELADSW